MKPKITFHISMSTLLRDIFYSLLITNLDKTFIQMAFNCVYTIILANR